MDAAGAATLGARRTATRLAAARPPRGLFAEAVAQGWDARGGLYYTLNYDGSPRVRDRLWWPICEGIGAGAFPRNRGEVWYRRFWDFAARHLIDARHGGWRCQLDDDLRPIPGYFAGKPDIYHALQACLIPLYGVEGSLTREISASGA